MQTEKYTNHKVPLYESEQHRGNQYADEKWNITSFPERLPLSSPIHYALPKFRGFISPVFKIYVNGITKYDLF